MGTRYRRSARAALALALALTGCGHSPRRAPSSHPVRRNAIVDYLCGAELQAEGDAQMDNLRAALRDLERLPPEQLRARRYADYQGRPGAWDLQWLLRRHFVPATAAAAGRWGSSFWQEVGASEVRALARLMLGSLERWNTHPPSAGPCGPR